MWKGGRVVGLGRERKGVREGSSRGALWLLMDTFVSDHLDISSGIYFQISKIN